MIFILFILLLIAGDIKPNHEPYSENSSIDNGTQNCLSMMHLNIRSKLRNKLNFLESFADDIDILCLTISHLDPSVRDADLAIEKFNQIFRKDRNMFGGGVIIYTSNDVAVTRRSDLEFDENEIIWMQLQ